jgi:hypothetical protein
LTDRVPDPHVLRPGRPHGRPGRLRAPTLVLTAVLVAVLAGCSGGGGAPQADAAGPRPAPVPPTTTATTAAPRTASTLPLRSYVRVPPSRPTKVEVPRIGISATLVQLGLSADGTMQVPAGRDYDRPGWFTGGPEPGQLGPAVIAGHVDSKSGPSIFYRLRELRAGDLVRVQRADGRTLRFVVDQVDRYPKADLPTDKVFGPVPWPALRLITCGGAFDRGSGHYIDNIVVSTRLQGA